MVVFFRVFIESSYFIEIDVYVRLFYSSFQEVLGPLALNVSYLALILNLIEVDQFFNISEILKVFPLEHRCPLTVPNQFILSSTLHYLEINYLDALQRSALEDLRQGSRISDQVLFHVQLQAQSEFGGHLFLTADRQKYTTLFGQPLKGLPLTGSHDKMQNGIIFAKELQIFNEFDLSERMFALSCYFKNHYPCVLNLKLFCFSVHVIPVHRVSQKAQDLFFIKLFIFNVVIETLEDLQDDFLLDSSRHIDCEPIIDIVDLFLAFSIPVDLQFSSLFGLGRACAHLKQTIYITVRNDYFKLLLYFHRIRQMFQKHHQTSSKSAFRMYYTNYFLQRQLRSLIFRALNKVYSQITRKISFLFRWPLRLLAYLRKLTNSAFFRTPSFVTLNLSKRFSAVLSSSSLEGSREVKELNSFLVANSSSYWVCQILVRLLFLGSLSQRPIQYIQSLNHHSSQSRKKGRFRNICFFKYAESKASLYSRKRVVKMKSDKIWVVVQGQQFSVTEEMQETMVFFQEWKALDKHSNVCTFPSTSPVALREWTLIMDIMNHHNFSLPKCPKVNSNEPTDYFGVYLSEIFSKMNLPDFNRLYLAVHFLKIEELRRLMAVFLATKVYISRDEGAYEERMKANSVSSRLTYVAEMEYRKNFSFMNI